MKSLTNLLRTHDEEVEQYFFRKLQEPWRPREANGSEFEFLRLKRKNREG